VQAFERKVRGGLAFGRSCESSNLRCCGCMDKVFLDCLVSSLGSDAVAR